MKIKSAMLVQDTYGHHIKITKVGLYDNEGKFIRWTKLNEAVIELIINQVIELDIKHNQ
jgi:hypothetical protein